MFSKIKDSLKNFKRIIYYILRQLVGIYFGLYLRKIHNSEFFPTSGPYIIVSNHLSYLDSVIVSSVFRKKFIVILASNQIKKQPIMYWLSKFNITIFADIDKSSISYIKEVLSALKRGYIVLVYPEGTRSRNGSMSEPKSGFVKIAHTLNVPIIPIGMKGTFDILPPHRIFPKFKRCEIFVGEKIFVNKDNIEYMDCFDKNGRITKLGNDEIAFRIMHKIAKTINQPWDKKVYSKLKDLGINAQEHSCCI